MLHLTKYGYDDVREILIAPQHIVSIQTANGSTEICVVTGGVYWVSESPDAIGKMSAWR
jgi:hypothetical protein